MARNSLLCADVPLRNYSLTHSLHKMYMWCVCFCVCSQVIHLAIQGFVCLAMMHLLRPGVMEKAVFVWAMGYLCFGHIYRLYYDYGGYTLDITGSVKFPHVCDFNGSNGM